MTIGVPGVVRREGGREGEVRERESARARERERTTAPSLSSVQTYLHSLPYAELTVHGSVECKDPQLSEEIRESNVFQHHRHFNGGTMRRPYHVWTPALLVNSLVFWYEVRSDIVAGISRTSFFFSHAHGTITF